MYGRSRERDQEVDDRRDRDVWDREKDNRYYDEHVGVEKKSNDSYKPHVSKCITLLLLFVNEIIVFTYIVH